MFDVVSVISTVISAALTAFVKLFPILNPPAMAPVFYEVTASVSEKQRNKIALKVSLNAFYLLTSLLLVGGWLLKILGVKIEMIGIAGGILLFHAAWGMLNRKENVPRPQQEEIQSMSGKAFFPLTIPMTAGPGAIAVTLSMVPEGQLFAISTVLNIIGLCMGIVIAAITVWLFYRFSGAFLSRLGNTAKATIGQLSAFILLAIGVQIIWSSLSSLIRGL
jgi:multiple antibiotic resistance protein